jgi:hypothetical protein
MRDEMVSKPLGCPGGLAQLFNLEGVANPLESQLSAAFRIRVIRGLLFLTGQGKTGSYVTGLDAAQCKELARDVRAACLCGMTDGPRALGEAQDLTNSYLIRPLRHHVARLIWMKQFEACAIALLG